MQRRGGIPSILDTWKEQFLTLFPLDGKRIFSDEDEMKQILIMSINADSDNFHLLNFAYQIMLVKKIVKTIEAKFKKYLSTLIYF